MNLLARPLYYWPLLILTAAATPLAFAPYYLFWLMPLLFAVLTALLHLRPERQIRSAYVFGLTAYTAQFYWVYTALHTVSGLPKLYAVPLTFLLPAYLALFPAAAVWLWRQTRLPRLLSAGIVLPLCWTLAEFARERLLTGFGWGALGYSQIADASPLAGWISIGGIHLLTLVTAACGTWLYLLVSRATPLRSRVVLAVCMAFYLMLGIWFKQTDYTRPVGRPVSVALIQGNIEQGLKFREDQFLPTLQTYYRRVADARADIVILPETAIPAMRQDLPQSVLDEFAAAARANGSALAVGIPQYTDDTRSAYLNSAVHLTADTAGSTPLPAYSKNHLVPFGEYKPLPALTEPLYRLMDMPLSDFRRGGAAQPPFDMAGQKVAFNICYEDGFGEELIASAQQATLLANISNMAWYGRSNAMFQQLQQSQARALELGRYMVRATNTGATAIVDHKGRIVSQALPDTETTLEGTVQGMSGQTPYMMYGSRWLWAVAAAVAALVLHGRLTRRKDT
ncbi:apolipoprotein N-acyltransferase [Neisseria leonii]|uniref:apolipoprotein N-acyltransferase n=1 Tax=Neisseria leonii TaxID=2995413 RepID=UPI00237B3724|nr:apolipoprotein N-acyltransferase [Neisseria sp. 3986]MDD9325229.1 apolipoprotein N-acyltransferase [Neisseria sp. 3986]